MRIFARKNCGIAGRCARIMAEKMAGWEYTWGAICGKRAEVNMRKECDAGYADGIGWRNDELNFRIRRRINAKWRNN